MVVTLATGLGGFSIDRLLGGLDMTGGEKSSGEAVGAVRLLGGFGNDRLPGGLGRAVPLALVLLVLFALSNIIAIKFCFSD